MNISEEAKKSIIDEHAKNIKEEKERIQLFVHLLQNALDKYGIFMPDMTEIGYYQQLLPQLFDSNFTGSRIEYIKTNYRSPQSAFYGAFYYLINKMIDDKLSISLNSQENQLIEMNSKIKIMERTICQLQNVKDTSLVKLSISLNSHENQLLEMNSKIKITEDMLFKLQNIKDTSNKEVIQYEPIILQKNVAINKEVCSKILHHLSIKNLIIVFLMFIAYWLGIQNKGNTNLLLLA